MSHMIPAEWLEATALSGVDGLAYFRGVADDDVFLITGGEDPQAVFLAGQYAGKSFRSRATTGRLGFAVSDIRIEVDPSSLFSPEKQGFLNGAIAIGSDSTFVLASTRGSYGFEDTLCWNLATGSGESFIPGLVGFRKWRISKTDGSEMRIVAEMAASEVER